MVSVSLFDILGLLGFGFICGGVCVHLLWTASFEQYDADICRERYSVNQNQNRYVESFKWIRK